MNFKLGHRRVRFIVRSKSDLTGVIHVLALPVIVANEIPELTDIAKRNCKCTWHSSDTGIDFRTVWKCR